MVYVKIRHIKRVRGRKGETYFYHQITKEKLGRELLAAAKKAQKINLTLEDRHVSLSGTTTIAAGRMLVLDGGTLNTGNLVGDGAFVFDSGTLGISQAGATVGFPIVTNSPSTSIRIFASDVSLGSTGVFTGFHHQGTLIVGAHTVTLRSGGYARLGVLTSLAGALAFARQVAPRHIDQEAAAAQQPPA